MRLINKRILLNLLFSGILVAGISACGGGESNSDANNEAEAKKEAPAEKVAEADPAKSIGVGPIKNVELGELDEQLAAEGKAVYEANCTACHKIEERYIGPPLKGITERRTPEWIMNMILNPEVMVKEDPQAKALLAEYLAPMANQSLTEEQARQILEYFRTLK